MTQNEIDEGRNFSGLMTAEAYYGELSKYPPLRSGDRHLDKLLSGGFRRGLVHLLIGSRKRNAEILMRAAVMAFMPRSNGGLGVKKVAYIDGNNRFSPYFISQMALSKNMSPREILSGIYVARAFNWSQIVELAEIKLTNLKGVGLVIISGLTQMFESGAENNQNLNQNAFNDLKSAINGIKKAISVNEPIVLISAPKHKQSLHKPVGGKIMTHFGCVIVEILEGERYIDYLLAQHPFMPQKQIRKWNRVSEQIMEKYNKWGSDYIEPESNPKPKPINNPGNANNDDYSKKLNNKNWKKTIQHPRSNGFTKEVRNLRLKEKRNRTNHKSIENKTQSLTLDYYLKKNKG
ncbi:MAG: hypothetical protein GY870_20190 [archaeon]|nr:hypothetical protein [archaeon]